MKYVIKPTIKNICFLIKRGLFSDDPDWFFKLHESLIDKKVQFEIVDDGTKDFSDRLKFVEKIWLKKRG